MAQSCIYIWKFLPPRVPRWFENSCHLVEWVNNLVVVMIIDIGITTGSLISIRNGVSIGKVEVLV